MRIHGMTIKQVFFLGLYYGIGYHLPRKTSKMGGVFSRKFRYMCCKHIFKQIGAKANIEKHASFGSGKNIVMGNYSSLGYKCSIPNDTVIGDYVMMGPNCYIFSGDNNHRTDRTDIPMVLQGKTPHQQTVIGNDVWIGRDVKILPGRHISDGSIIATGCV